MRDELAQLACGIREENAPTCVNDWMTRRCKRFYDRYCSLFVKRRLMELARVAALAIEQRNIDFLGEDVHRDRHQHGSGASVFGKLECLLDNLGKEVGPFDSPCAFDERPVDF